MNKPLTITVACASFVATTLAGVGLSRSLSDGGDASATPATPAEALFDADGKVLPPPPADTPDGEFTAADFEPPPDQLVPVLEPAAIGYDDAVGDTLLEQLPPGAVPAGLGDHGAAPASYAGAVAISTDAPERGVEADADDDSTPEVTAGGDPDDASSESGGGAEATDETGDSDDPDEEVSDLWWFDGWAGRLLPLPPLRFDPCAGLTPGTPVPDDCPEGYPAAFGGMIETPPPPFAFFARGHYLEDPTGVRFTCPADTPPPADGEIAMTLFTRTPLSEMTARVRPYGTDGAWVDVPMPASSPEQIAWWNERYDTLEYDIEWATMPICFNMPRNPSIAYSIDGSGTDTFGQPVDANDGGVVGLDDPQQRPPTTATVTGLSSVATVTTRSVPGGMVQFRSRVVTGPDDDLQCGRAEPVDATIATATSPVNPVGVYDPDYNKAHIVRIPIPPGAQLVVCAEVFPTTNPLRPTATDRLLLAAPTQERPRIVLQGIRRLGDATLERVTISAGFDATGGDYDRCISSGYNNPDPLAAHRSYSIEQTLWECADAALPVDAAGAVDVPVQVTKIVGGEWMTEEAAIPIRLQSCLDPAGCGRPREWYEIPIPSGSRTLCGTGFGECDPDADLDGIAVIRVDYPVVAAAEVDPARPSWGAVTLLDQVDATPASGTPRVQVTDVQILPAAVDTLLRTARLDIVADRPVHITVSVPEELDAACSTPAPIEPEGFASEFSLEMSGLCAGSAYSVRIHAVDEAGNEFDFERGSWFSVPSIAAHLTAELEFLGGDGVPGFGYIYQLGISVEGQTPTAYWFDVDGPQGATGRSCYALAGTTARSRGYWEPTSVTPGTLDVRVRVNITTTGNADCSGRPSTGLGEITLEGSFEPDTYLDERVLVLETEPGATLPMRLTLTRDGPWR